MIEKLLQITAGLNRRFPDGDHPFQIMTRLLEEAGELAQMVNHFEGAGIKWEKYGPPDPAKLAKEAQDVIRCALQVVLYYGVEADLEARLEQSYQQLMKEGYLPEA